MLVLRPLKYTLGKQEFGKNRACALIRKNGSLVFPYVIRSKRFGKCPKGYVEFYPRIGLDGHNGVDFSSYYKQPIFFNILAECDFFVYNAETNPDIGIGLEIVSKEPVYIHNLPSNTPQEVKNFWEKNERRIHIKVIFWHAQSNTVNVGDTVKTGDLIQYADSTGASSGNHLHFAIKFCLEDGDTIGWDNGYKGAIDYKQIWAGESSSVYKNIFVLDFLDRRSGLTPVQEIRGMAYLARGRTRTVLLKVADVIEQFVGSVVGFNR